MKKIINLQRNFEWTKLITDTSISEILQLLLCCYTTITHNYYLVIILDILNLHVDFIPCVINEKKNNS